LFCVGVFVRDLQKSLAGGVGGGGGGGGGGYSYGRSNRYGDDEI